MGVESDFVRETLAEARDKLADREAKLREMVHRAKPELAEITRNRHRLDQMLGGEEADSTRRSRERRAGAVEVKRRAVLRALVEACPEPLSISEIAERAGVDGRGILPMLRGMDGQVTQVEETGNWVATASELEGSMRSAAA